jgi:hypothetical protein
MQKRDLSIDLDRLVAATAMFVRQQSERATLGDDQECEDAKQETHSVVNQVLQTIEKNLDEDLLENLDRGQYPRVASAYGCWPRLPNWRSWWPYYNYYSPYTTTGGRLRMRPVHRSTRGTADMLDEILDDFRADFEARMRKARREDRALTDAELDDSLQGLREDLSVIARRSRRREDRREEEESHNGRTR